VQNNKKNTQNGGTVLKDRTEELSVSYEDDSFSLSLLWIVLEPVTQIFFLLFVCVCL